MLFTKSDPFYLFFDILHLIFIVCLIATASSQLSHDDRHLVTLSAKGIVRRTASSNWQRLVPFGLSFRGCLPGVIYEQGNGDNRFEIALLANGSLRIALLSNSSNVFKRVFDRRSFRDNRWHSFLVNYRAHRLYFLLVDDGESFLLSDDVQQIRAVLSSPILIGRNFAGCFYDIVGINFRATDTNNNEGVRRKCHVPDTNECDIQCTATGGPLSCLHNGTCRSDEFFSSARCTCGAHYRGNRCQYTNLRCHDDYCMNNATCYVTTSHRSVCHCKSGYYGSRCNLGLLKCQPNFCMNNGRCFLKDGLQKCDCSNTGFTGDRCHENVNECEISADTLCRNGGTCYDAMPHYVCVCAPGWSGSQCVEDINECLLTPSVCGNRICTNTPGNYTCDCDPSTSGDGCATDDTGAISTMDYCDSTRCVHGICISAGNGTRSKQRCYCIPGYIGRYCEVDNDECALGPCRHGGTCHDLQNAFSCTCAPGYTGVTCERNIDECDNHECANGATCVDQLLNYTCLCAPGYTGPRCRQDIDECLHQPCENNATCIDKVNSYVCDCRHTGFTGVNCSVNIDDCRSVVCDNGGTCVDEILGFHCLCHRGFTGQHCDTDVDECASSPCLHNGTCYQHSDSAIYMQPRLLAALNLSAIYRHSAAAGFSCLCARGYTGALCQVNVDDCANVTCSGRGQCVDRVGGYTCTCWHGYTGIDCGSEVDECALYGTAACQHGTCMDRLADYSCVCEPGYGGRNCSVRLIGCERDSCHSSAICRPTLSANESVHGYTCVCASGRAGPLCATSTSMQFLYGASQLVFVAAKRLHIRFDVRTSLTSANLLHARAGAHTLQLHVDGAHFCVSVDASIVNCSGRPINDSVWHSVRLRWTGHLADIALSVDSVAVGATPVSAVSRHSVSETVSPAAVSAATAVSTVHVTLGGHFAGCIRDLYLSPDQLFLPVAAAPATVPAVAVASNHSTILSQSNIQSGCSRTVQCNKNVCHNSGQCIDLWNTARCDCRRPYIGRLCNQSIDSVTFNHASFVHKAPSHVLVRIARNISRYLHADGSFTISFFMRTRSTDAVVFYVGARTPERVTSQGVFVVSLSGGRLAVSPIIGSPFVPVYSHQMVNDGQNNMIKIQCERTQMLVYVNRSLQINVTDSNCSQFLLHQITFAQLPNDLLEFGFNAPTNSLFKGSLQDFRISDRLDNDYLVYFFPLNVNQSDSVLPEPLGLVSDVRNLLLGSISDPLCDSNPCENNSTCILTWNAFRCVCAKLYKGRTCSQTRYCAKFSCPIHFHCRELEQSRECLGNATFNGRDTASTYSFVNRRTNGTSVSVPTHIQFQLSFRTIHTNASLIYLSSAVAQSQRPPMIDVFIDSDGQLCLRLHRVSLNLTQSALSDGRWHRFDLWLNFTHAHLRVDRSVLPALTLPLSMRPLAAKLFVAVAADSFEITLGRVVGHVDSSQVTGFVGCMYEPRVLGRLLAFENDSHHHPRSVLAPRKSVTLTGCTLCTGCENGGRCVDPDIRFECACPAGYAGVSCEQDIDECAHAVCRHGGTCVDGVGAFECVCALDYWGVNCERRVTNCSQARCQNSDGCSNTNLVDHSAIHHRSREGLVATGFICHCLSGYTGTYCERPIDYCDSNPCKNSAQCVSVFGQGYNCLCKDGYIGQDCSIDIDECANNSCLHNSTCVDFVNHYECVCQPGWFGVFCEHDINECEQHQTLCLNDGKCMNTNGSFLCLCPQTHCGTNCSYRNHCYHYTTRDRESACLNEGTCEPLCSSAEQLLHREQFSDISEGPPPHRCRCGDGFYGSRCEHEQFSSHILSVVIPLLSIIVLFVVAGISFFTIVARNKRATRGTYSPSRQERYNPRVELGSMKKPPPEERLI